eukprot:scaffold34141_cov161-Skeletonema_dohrnii-CCMP3373.AAC.2
MDMKINTLGIFFHQPSSPCSRTPPVTPQCSSPQNILAAMPNEQSNSASTRRAILIWQGNSTRAWN